MDAVKLPREYGLQGVVVKEYSGTHGEGLIVDAFTSPSLARDLGILDVGDVIMTADDVDVKSPDDLHNAVRRNLKEDIILLVVRHAPASRKGLVVLRAMQAVEEARNATPLDNIAYMRSLFSLAKVLIESAMYFEARETIEKIMNICESTEKTPAYDVIEAACFHALGQISVAENDIVAAEHNFQDAINIYRGLGSYTIRVLEVITHIKTLKELDHNVDETSALRHQIEDMEEVILSEVTLAHNKYSQLWDIARVATLDNRMTDALRYFDILLQIKPNLSTDDAVMYTQLLTAKAEIFMRQEKFEEAMELHQQALQIRLQFSENEIVIAESKNNIGRLLIQASDYGAAEEYLLEALKLRREYCGVTHPAVGETAYLLAELYRTLNQFDFALHFHHVAVYIFKLRFHDRTPAMISALGSYGITLRQRALADTEASVELIGKSLMDINNTVIKGFPYGANMQILSALYQQQAEKLKEADAAIASKEAELNTAATVTVNDEDAHLPEEKSGLYNPFAISKYLMETGESLTFSQCDFQSSKVLYTQCYIHLCNKMGEITQPTLRALTELGNANRHLGLYSQAEKVFMDCVRDFRKLLTGTISSADVAKVRRAVECDMAAAICSWGFNLFDQGEYQSAKSKYQQAMDLLRPQFGEMHASIYELKLGLAQIYTVDKRFVEAEEILSDVYPLARDEMGGFNHTVAKLALAYGTLKMNMCQYNDAMTYFQQSMVVYKSLYKEDNVFIVPTYLEMAKCYLQRAMLEEAVMKLDDCLRICRKFLDAGHPVALDCAYWKAEYTLLTGQIMEAKTLHESILVDRLKALGKHHTRVADSYTAIGKILALLGFHEESKPKFEEAITIRKQVYGESHPMYADTLLHKARALHLQGEIIEAQNIYEDALTMQRELLGKTHVEVLITTEYMISRDIDAECDAEETSNKIKTNMKSLLTLFPDDHHLIAGNMCAHGKLKMHQTKYAEAVALLEDGYNMYNRLFGKDHYLTIEAQVDIAYAQVYNRDIIKVRDDNKSLSKSRSIDVNALQSMSVDQAEEPVPVFNNTLFLRSMDIMKEAVEQLAPIYGSGTSTMHPRVAEINGDIGIIETIEEEERLKFVEKLTNTQRVLYLDNLEKKNELNVGNTDMAFSAIPPGQERIRQAVSFFRMYPVSHMHSALVKFSKYVTTEVAPRNAIQLVNKLLGSAKEHLGKESYRDAEKMYQDILELLMNEGESKPEDMVVMSLHGDTLLGLAHISYLQNKIATSRQQYNESIEMLRQSSLQENLAYASALFGSAELMILEGYNVEGADMLYDKVLTIRRRILEKEHHEDIFLAIFGKMKVALELARYDAVQSLIGQLEAINQVAYIHMKVKLPYMAYRAKYMIQIGNFIEAEEMLNSIMKLCQQHNITEHMVISDCYQLRGEIKLFHGAYKDALRNFKTAQLIQMKFMVKYGVECSDLNDSTNPFNYSHSALSQSQYLIAETMRREGKFADALEIFQRLVPYNHVLYNEKDHASLAHCIHGLACCYFDMAKLSEAEQQFDQAHSLLSRLYHDEVAHPDVAESMYDLSLFAMAHCRYNEAICKLQETLDMLAQVYGPSSVHMAKVYTSLGQCYTILHDFDRAEKTYQRSLELIQEKLSNNHLLSCYCNFGMANNLHNQESYTAAEVLYKNVISIATSILGETHPDIGTFLIGHASNLEARGLYIDAKLMYQQGLSIHKRSYGLEHPATLRSLLCVGSSVFNDGKYNDALQFYRRCLYASSDLFTNSNRPHELIAASHYGIARCHYVLGGYEEALTGYQHALNLRRRIFGANHADSLLAQSGIASVNFAKGNLAEAEHAHNECIEMLRQTTDKESNLLATLLSRVADAIYHSGKIDQAKSMYERALGIRRRLLNNHPIIGDLLCSIADVLLDLGLYSKARASYEKAYSLYQEVYHDKHPLYAKLLFGLAQCHRVNGNYTTAARQYLKAVQLHAQEFNIHHPQTILMISYYAESLRLNGCIVPKSAAVTPPVSPSPNDDTENNSEDAQQAPESDAPKPPPSMPTFELVDILNDEKVDTLTSLPMLRKLYEIMMTNHGDHHFSTIHVKNLLALSEVSCGNFEKALELQREILCKRQQLYGKNYKYLAQSLYNIAEVLRMSGRYYPLEDEASRVPAGGGKNKSEYSAILSTLVSLPSESISPVPGPLKKIRGGYMGYEFPEVVVKDEGDKLSEDRRILYEINELLGLKVKRKGKELTSSEQAEELAFDACRLYDIVLMFLNDLYPPNGTTHVFTGAVLFAKAELMRCRKSFEDATTLYKQALTLRQRLLRSDHPDVADVVFGMAENYRADGKCKMARPLYEQSLSIRLQTFGNDSRHPSIALAKWGLGNLFYDTGDFQEARNLYVEALELLTETLGAEHHWTAQVQHSLANVLQNFYEFIEAKRLYECALKTKIAVFGRHHIEVASCLNNLALLLKAQGFYDESKRMFERVMNIQVRTYGHKHPDVAISLNNIGAVFFAQGLYHDALPFYQKSLEMKKDCFGIDHHLVASSMHNLGGVYQSLQMFDKANAMYEEALAIRSLIYDAHHPAIADTLNNFGILLYSQEKFNEAEPMFQRAIDIKKRAFGENHPSYASSMHNLAALYHSVGRLEDAQSYYQKCLEIRRNVLGPEHPDTVACDENLDNVKLQIADRDANSFAKFTSFR